MVSRLTQPRVRIASTLITNALRSLMSFGTAILIARSLGAADFGNLSFLLAGFVAISQLTDMGTSAAFYTLISRRRQAGRFIGLYFVWLAAQFILVALLISLLPSSTIHTLFVGHDRWLVLLAFVANFGLTQLWNAVTQLGEAARQTVLVQLVGILPAVVHLIAVVALAHFGLLTVAAVLWLLLAEYLVTTCLIGPRLLRANIAVAPSASDDWRSATRDFVVYCRPLVLYTWSGFLVSFADRWLLQRYGGAEQQGYFSVGQQFAAVSLFAAAAVLRVFWKEVAESHESGDHVRNARLFHSASRSLFFFSAWMCALLIPFSREILHWTVGSDYTGAWLSMAFLLAFPAFQTVGQIQGAFFYATGDTKAYAALGIFMMVLSLPITYFLVAPKDAAVAGLHLGALGIAAKMLIVQVVNVNLQAWLIAWRNDWRADILHRLLMPIGLVGLAIACRTLGTWLTGPDRDALLDPSGIVVAGLIYLAVTAAVFWVRPEIAGLTRADIARFISVVTRRPV